jgi:predicted dithiol-disulfide oxidoreductase (DUF899 family)
MPLWVIFDELSGRCREVDVRFGRGGEQFLGIFAYFDVLPKGREEYGPRHSLPDWVKIRTEYDASVVDSRAL